MLEYALKTQAKRSNKKSNKSKNTMIPVCPSRHLNNEACPIQRVIAIGGNVYSKFDDLDEDEEFKIAFISAFADPKIQSSRYLANKRIGKNLDYYLFRGDVHSFNSFQDLFDKCLPQVFGYLRYTPDVVFQNMAPVWIIMTGSRSMDFQAANRMCQYKKTPKGYTWHHIEGIYSAQAGRVACRMILLESGYHSIWHVGAVKQYEILKNTDYH